MLSFHTCYGRADGSGIADAVAHDEPRQKRGHQLRTILVNPEIVKPQVAVGYTDL